MTALTKCNYAEKYRVSIHCERYKRNQFQLRAVRKETPQTRLEVGGCLIFFLLEIRKQPFEYCSRPFIIRGNVVDSAGADVIKNKLQRKFI